MVVLIIYIVLSKVSFLFYFEYKILSQLHSIFVHIYLLYTNVYFSCVSSQYSGKTQTHTIIFIYTITTLYEINFKLFNNTYLYPSEEHTSTRKHTVPPHISSSSHALVTDTPPTTTHTYPPPYMNKIHTQLGQTNIFYKAGF